MRFRFLIAAVVALVAGASSGCFGDGDEPAQIKPGPPVQPPRLERPELVSFRTAGASTVRYELVVSRANGQVVRVLAGGSERDRLRPALFERAAWSPDGSRLAFTAEMGALAGVARDVYIIRADGSGLRRLTTGGRSFHPLWAA